MEIVNKCFLLFIEPHKSSDNIPVIDPYTRKITGAFRLAQKGVSLNETDSANFYLSEGGYRGTHSCICGHAGSSNQDYLLKTKEQVYVKLFSSVNGFSLNDTMRAGVDTQAVITNSLCIHYVACHRNEIDPKVLERILLLEAQEVNPTEEELQNFKRKAVRNEYRFR